MKIMCTEEYKFGIVKVYTKEEYRKLKKLILTKLWRDLHPYATTSSIKFMYTVYIIIYLLL